VLRRRKKRTVQKRKKGGADDLEGEAIYWQGWIKYFHYNNNTRFIKPHAFFQNNEYYLQRINVDDMDSSDQYGIIRIPSKHSFYLVIYNYSLIFHSNRKDPYSRSFDSLKLDHINLVPEDEQLMGGVSDLGNFNEGYCIELKATLPMKYHKNFDPIHNFKGLGQTWILCAESQQTKNYLLNLLVKVKIKMQRDLGEFLTLNDIKNLRKRKKS